MSKSLLPLLWSNMLVFFIKIIKGIDVIFQTLFKIFYFCNCSLEIIISFANMIYFGLYSINSIIICSSI